MAANTTCLLWQQMATLQPTLLGTKLASRNVYSKNKEERDTLLLNRKVDKSCKPHFSFSVVPPPVTNAQNTFIKFIDSLFSIEPHPVFVNITSYSPYFVSYEDEVHARHVPCKPENVLENTPELKLESSQGAKTEESFSTNTSATQFALDYIMRNINQHRECQVNLRKNNLNEKGIESSNVNSEADTCTIQTSVCLAVTATRSTHIAQDASNANTNNYYSLTGATQDGVTSVIADFVHRTAALVPHGSPAVLLLRGEDGNYELTRRLQVLNSSSTTEYKKLACNENITESEPYVDFHNVQELFEFVSSILVNGDGRNNTRNSANVPVQTFPELTLCVAGYPQGHPLHRKAHSCHTENVIRVDEGTEIRREELALCCAAQILHNANQTLLKRDHVYRSSTRQIASYTDHNECEAQKLVLRDKLEQSIFIDDRLMSDFEVELKEAIMKTEADVELLNVVIDLSSDKLHITEEQLCKEAKEVVIGKCLHNKANVIITQMLTSVEEFIDYVSRLQKVIREQQEQQEQKSHVEVELQNVFIVPAIMSPLPAMKLAKRIVQMKVNSGEMLPIIISYKKVIEETKKELEIMYNALVNNTNANTEHIQTTIRMGEQEFRLHKTELADIYRKQENANNAFLRSITQYTREMCDELSSLGYQHIHFFTFDYDCVAHLTEFVRSYKNSS